MSGISVIYPTGLDKKYFTFPKNVQLGQEWLRVVNNPDLLVMDRARILGKMDYFYFLRHMYETCL
jgi:hypothetical protein